VIEDNRADFVIVEYYLKKADGMDFRLQRAVRLADGLASLATGGVDLVLLDLVLPDSQGWETFRSVRLHAPQVPIIVLTGLDDESVASEAAQEGAQDYLIKGQFDGPTLVRSIHRALARHRGG
jgi:DNA-binding response OmpR family regulator